MIDLSKVRNYYVACGYTDLRRGIDGLASIVTLQYGQEMKEDSLFLFCGRRTDRIKALYWCGDGYILALQTTQQRQLSVALFRVGTEAAGRKAVSLADGGLANCTAEGYSEGTSKE